MPYLSYRYKLLPTKAQHAALGRILEDQRQLYNAALEERIGAWKKASRMVTLYEQYRSLTVCRRELPEMRALPAHLQRWTLKQLDFSYSTFFRKLRAGQKAGFPRFRGKERFRSFGFQEFETIRIVGRRIRFRGIPGGLKIHFHRPLPNDASIKACSFRQRDGQWTLILQIEVKAETTRPLSRAIGVDLGIETLATLSDGTQIPNLRHERRAKRELRRKHRAVARCKRGSKRRVKATRAASRVHWRCSNTKNTYLHQVSAALIASFDLIAFEKLAIENLRKGRLAEHILSASWARLIKFTQYKAENAGAVVVLVDAAFTSQDCSNCGDRVPKLLGERLHRCSGCGLVLSRDHNAAVNILARAVARPEVAKLVVTPVSPRNTAEASPLRSATLFAVSI